MSFRNNCFRPLLQIPGRHQFPIIFPQPWSPLLLGIRWYAAGLYFEMLARMFDPCIVVHIVASVVVGTVHSAAVLATRCSDGS